MPSASGEVPSHQLMEVHKPPFPRGKFCLSAKNLCTSMLVGRVSPETRLRIRSLRLTPRKASPLGRSCKWVTKSSSSGSKVPFGASMESSGAGVRPCLVVEVVIYEPVGVHLGGSHHLAILFFPRKRSKCTCSLHSLRNLVVQMEAGTLDDDISASTKGVLS